MSTVTTARTTVHARFAAIVGERKTVPNERMRVHSLRKRNVELPAAHPIEILDASIPGGRSRFKERARAA